MSRYTTGELAKLCGVTVRTVQYYDTRGILVPSELSEGGRRLYSEEDLERMRIICFLRELDLPISAISQLFAEEHPEKVIHLLLEQQERALREEIGQKQEKLDSLVTMQRELRSIEHFSVESIGDIAYMMKNRSKLRKIRTVMLAFGIPMGLCEIAVIMLWIVKGVWWPFLVWLAADIVYGVIISRYYYKNVSYICPECHAVFRPSFREVFWANHTPNTRRLTCPGCGHQGFCVETAEGGAE